MLHKSTQCSGITAGHDILYRFLTVGLPFFVPLWYQCLRCLIEGALEAVSPCIPSPGRAASLLPFGREFLALSSLRSMTFGCALFALAVRFVISLRFHARSCPPSAPGKGGVPNSSPSRLRLILGAAVASIDARAKPRLPSATPRMFACELLGFLQFEKNSKGLFVRKIFFKVEASPL